MFMKQNEIEALVENLIEDVVLEAFQDCFENKRECEVALDILKSKIDELDYDVFDELFL